MADEMKNKTPDVVDPVTQAEVNTQAETATDPNESFLGSMLIAILSVIIVGVVGFFGYFGYRIWRENKVIADTPSIDRLSVETPPVAEQTPPPTETTPSQESAPAQQTIDKAALEIKVLNGGAAKGSAGSLVDLLKKAGYAKAAFGNTASDFAGVTIYYAEGKSAEAELLKGDVAKTYATAKIAQAIPSNKDTVGASLVVILGK